MTKDSMIEQEIRALDLQEADAVLNGDFATVQQLWAEDYTVNNPFNKVVKASAGPIRTGALTYASFVREIESIQIHGETVIVMGRETVMPKDNSPDAGTTIRRRYTNIWMKKEGEWRLTARHANVVNSNGESLRQETLSNTEEDVDEESVRSSAVAEEERLRATEQERLRALVDADMAVARRLHADDFQLITPGGSYLSKEAYLGSVGSGKLNYVAWEPGAIAVRLKGDMAIIRYQAQIEIIGNGKRLPLGTYWHTDSYEKRDGQWQVVWSQATEIK